MRQKRICRAITSHKQAHFRNWQTLARPCLHDPVVALLPRHPCQSLELTISYQRATRMSDSCKTNTSNLICCHLFRRAVDQGRETGAFPGTTFPPSEAGSRTANHQEHTVIQKLQINRHSLNCVVNVSQKEILKTAGTPLSHSVKQIARHHHQYHQCASFLFLTTSQKKCARLGS